MTTATHKYDCDTLVWYRGQRVAIQRLLWSLKGRPMYDIFGTINPVHEEELDLTTEAPRFGGSCTFGKKASAVVQDKQL